MVEHIREERPDEDAERVRKRKTGVKTVTGLNDCLFMDVHFSDALTFLIRRLTKMGFGAFYSG